MTQYPAFLMVPAVTILGLFVSGCSAIGYGIGSVVDSSNLDTVWVDGDAGWRMEHLGSTRIMVESGTTYDVDFRGISILPESTYESSYMRAVSRGELDLPRFHDSIEIRRTPGTSAERRISGEFLGFGIDDTSPRGGVRFRRSGEVKVLNFSTIEEMTDKKGRVWAGGELQTRMDEGTMPVDRGIKVSFGSADTLLALSDVDSILVLDKPDWRWVGFGVGLAADVAALAAIAIAMSDFNFDLSPLSRSR